MITLKGLAGSIGYASGTAVVKRTPVMSVPMHTVSDVDVEVARFEAARQSYDKQLTALAARISVELGAKTAGIFDAHRIILNDDVFFDKVLDRVRRERVNVECIIEEEYRSISIMLGENHDKYMRERTSDIENVCMALIRTMMGVPDYFFDESTHYEDIILVCDDLTPVETVRLNKSTLRGLVTERGGTTSHTVILAKALDIPAIVGVEQAPLKISTGTTLLLDAYKGEVIIDPDGKYKEDFFAMLGREHERILLYASHCAGICETVDKHSISVNINSGDSGSLAIFSPENCDGIGLLRTEFLYMESLEYPHEDFQYDIYKDIAQRAAGKEVIIRTLDIGGDKQVPYMHLPKEDNPSLGKRAIRLCFERRDMFLVQLRAILRAAIHGSVRVMFPMIVTVEELLEIKAIIAQASESLNAENIPHKHDLPIGIMIETPSAVILSDKLALHCDFFSIGSNDLIQYITAADRLNQNVQDLYESCNIAVLRSIHAVAKNAEAAGIPWGICGEAASEDILVPLWAAMGVSHLSVSPNKVGRVKFLIRKCSRSKLIPGMRSILDYSTIGEVKAHLCGILADLDK